MIDLFCALIERFEKGCSLTNDIRLKKYIGIQTHAIIASFIKLDIDTNPRNFFHQKQDLTRAIKCKNMKIGLLDIIYGFNFVQLINCKWQLIQIDGSQKETQASINKPTVIFMSAIDYHHVVFASTLIFWIHSFV